MAQDQDAESHKTLAFEDADTSHEEELEQPKEGLDMNARTMTATNAASGTFGLGLDQFELPKASIAKLLEMRCVVICTNIYSSLNLCS